MARVQWGTNCSMELSYVGQKQEQGLNLKFHLFAFFNMAHLRQLTTVSLIFTILYLKWYETLFFYFISWTVWTCWLNRLKYVCMFRGGFPHALRPRMWSIVRPLWISNSRHARSPHLPENGGTITLAEELTTIHLDGKCPQFSPRGPHWDMGVFNVQ
jgi:hypothetical protein